MAVFNKNSLYQVSGFDNPIITGELVYQQRTFWNLSITNTDGDPVDLTGATIDAQIIRRVLSNVKDSRYGLTFDIADFNPPPSPIPCMANCGGSNLAHRKCKGREDEYVCQVHHSTIWRDTLCR